MGKEPPKKIFLQYWPQCFVTFMGVVEVLAAIILFLTELGNVAANFWTTNVFAGGWCGLVILIHAISVFVVGCCSPGPKSAYRATIIGVIGILASATMIGFDAYFVAQPSTCLLTPSCTTNAASNTTFSYNFRQSFFTVFNSWSPFKTYQELQVKFLCQTIQLGVGSVCFILCLIYLIIYYICKSKATKQAQIAPQPPQPYYPQQSYYPPPQPIPQPYNSQPIAQQGYYPPAPVQPQYYQAPQQAWYAPQPPGVVPFNPNRRN